MGTRNLTAVMKNGEYKIAQYGQWDGYPEGQGMTALNFARKLNDGNFRKQFEEKLLAASWITQEDIDSINAKIKSGEIKDWTKVYPELSRDTCADILELVAKAPAGIKLNNNIEFAADGLFCEFAWIIDLDKNSFEGYVGFGKKPLVESDRFFFLRDKEENGYSGVKLVAEWDLSSLPTDDDFVAAFKEKGPEWEDMREVCESLEWAVHECEDGTIELEKYSPAGEDFVFTVKKENFIEEVKQYADDFDTDEHIEMWIEARKNGSRGVPSATELVKDAEDIDAMLQELSSKLAELEEV